LIGLIAVERLLSKKLEMGRKNALDIVLNIVSIVVGLFVIAAGVTGLVNYFTHFAWDYVGNV